ncbi:Hypothetical_protein [Hexamita inflata]|uniref:Hypothetical_protein n=1 Tax=Hexamita inflata TaxID=28002 RepID=A0AA86PDZ2_9EUKA|nr:Hypothetical protein HINF_LOCUS24934 [Hexamita inflata]
MGCAAAKSLPQVNQYSSSDQKFLNLVMKYQESVKQDNDKYEEARDMLYGAVQTNNINCRSDSIEVVNMLLKFITAETIIFFQFKYLTRSSFNSFRLYLIPHAWLELPFCAYLCNCVTQLKSIISVTVLLELIRLGDLVLW